MADMNLAGYRDITLVGQGGLGKVYRAVRESTGGLVAIKELPDIAAASPAWHRARRELDAMLRLKGHPFVVSVEEIVDGPNGPCIVMEYVPGGSLYERLGFGPLTGPEIVLVGQQVSQALAAAHEVGIVHRDVKPHNLLVGSFGQVKVCDFGIASLVRGVGGRTQTQALTLGYASPEELDGDTTVGPLADVYSFGATVMHLLSGRKPSFQDRLAGVPVVVDAHLNDAVRAPVVAALVRCLAHRASDRPSMAEVAAQFDSAAYQLGPNRLTRLDPIDPSDQRTTVRPAPGAQDFGSRVLPLPVPAIVPAFAAPPTSGSDGRFYDSTHFRPDATQFATTNGGIQPPSTVEPSQPRRRGLLALLIATGAILAVCIGLIIGLVTSDRSAASPSADAAGPVATASTVASSSDAPATTPAPATSAPATAVPETAVPVAQTLPLAVVPETAAPPTIPPQTLPEVPPTAVAVSQPLPGDLFVSRPMTKPACDGSYVTMVGSSVLPDQYARVVQANLDAYPTSQYLLTETTCPSLSPRTSQGNLIYSIYLGPFGTKAEACAARSMGPADAYIRILDTTTPATAQQLCG